MATVGMRGYNMTGDTLLVAQPQLNVSGEKGKYPEFADNVRTVDICDRRIEPGGDYHYGQNADTYQELPMPLVGPWPR
jgi:hypothetical protein